MKTSPRFQKIIETIAKNYNFDLTEVDAKLKLTNGGYEPLIIRVLAKNVVAVSHIRGDGRNDPLVIFFTGYGEWVAIEIDQAFGGSQEVGFLDPEGKFVQYYKAKPQASVASLVNLWGGNLKSQGWTNPKNTTRHAGYFEWSIMINDEDFE